MCIFPYKKTPFLFFPLAVLALLGGCRSLETPLGADMYLRDSGEEDINGVFPDAVYIKTRTQTFNSYHYYIIRDGLIWHKSIDETKGPREWTLFKKTGLPRNPWKIGFANPKKIVNISADADELAALSEDGRFYRFCFDKVIGRRNNVWLDRQGWPIEEQLFLDERTSNNTAWALGKRNSYVLYYEDPFGNQHHNGTMEISTTYLLLEDGQEICYADPGLPSDFSRNYLGPERGAFKAIALSVSASTMFVMNDAGEMYTRIADFDIIGCDPMFFKYTYIPYKSSLPGTNYFSNLNEWGLPPEDWRPQGAIPLEGKAAISRYITILQNGQGNGARELRVAGIDGEGNTGYWTKAIFGGRWEFVKVPLYFPPGSLWRNGGRGERSRSLDTRLSGYRWNGDERDSEYVYEIPNFNILEGSCEFRITRGNESCALILHPVELWTYQKRDYTPGRSGALKLFFVTLDIGPYAYNGLSEEFKAYLNEHYGKNNKTLFQYILGARTNYVVLWDKDDTDSVLFLTDGSISNHFPDFQNSWYTEYAGEVQTFNSPEFVIAGDSVITGDHYAEILHKIELNEGLREELIIKVAALEKAKLLAFGVNAGYLPLDGILRFSLLQFVDVPKIRTMMRFGQEIVLVNSAYINTASNTQIWIYKKIIDRLDLRILMLKDLARQATREKPAAPPKWYAENAAAYWNIAGLPERISGVFFESDLPLPPARRAVLSFAPREGDLELFGWYLSAGDSPAYTFFVDPEKSLRTIYLRRGKPPVERTISLDCTIYISENIYDGIEKVIMRHGLRRLRTDNNAMDANISFDGENFIIRRRARRSGGDEIIFRGKAVR
ncbi:MAG: hypothetical protein LBS06_06800, partial [Treponema sp.]|nr:hypothetical protein [Treponema sp.]